MPGPQAHPVVLFDGVCQLCNGTVHFVLRRDPRAVFRFAPLQSPAGRELLAAHGLDPMVLDGVVLLQDGKAYLKSDAVLQVAAHLSSPWPLLRFLLRLPRGLRDCLYDLVARHRYRWFGRRETCMLPAPELRDRFLN